MKYSIFSRYIFFFALYLLPLLASAQVKVGENPTNIEPSAALEIESTTQGFLPPRMTEAQMNAIVSPAEGLMVFCTDCMPKGLRLYDGTDWTSLSPSGPETTVSMDCSIDGFTGGDLVEGQALSGQTFSLTVANNSFTDASLNFATSDLTLSGVGGISVTGVSPASTTLSGAGSSQLVTYTLSGTPASEGTLSVAVDIAGLLSCEESAVVFDASTGGTGIVGSYGEPDCSAPAFSAELIQGVDATGTTLTLYANVTQAGTYSLSLTENGVTFADSGTFAATGCQPIVLTATGTPTSSGTFTWTSNTTPAGSATAEVLSPTTGGTGVVSSYGQPDCDAPAFSGALVEGVDATGTTLTLYANVTQTGTWSLSLTENGVAFSGSGTFAATGCQPIVLTASGTPTSSGTYTWTSNTMPVASATADVEDPSSGGTGIVSSYGQPDCDAPAFSAALTEGIDATGTTLTLYADVAQAGTYSLSLTENGVTFAGSGTFAATGCQPIVLTASGTPLADGSFTWTSSTTPEASATTDVLSESSNGTSVVSAYGGPGCSGGTGSITGTMTQGATVSGVTMELYAEVTQTGTWSLEATENGVTFSGSGTFVATGCQLTTLTGSGTPAASGDFTWTTNSTPSADATANVSVAIPATITLAQNLDRFIASVFDQDYLPYTAPTGPATTSTVAADGTNEATAIDIQGSISTSGITVNIPVTATGSGTLPGFSTAISIPAALTEDGVSRDLTLSWAEQSFTSGTTAITATIAAVGGTLNIKKLDVNSGIGNDNRGVLMGSFSYPYDNAGNMTSFEVRGISGIVDRMFGIADNAGDTESHKFIYVPVESPITGKIWLNNNLGANYANVNHPSFNPAQQAQATNDFNAYGSTFQWGRKPDGHELINRNNPGTSPAVHGPTGVRSNNPSYPEFITDSGGPFYGNWFWDWRTFKQVYSGLWDISSPNNPCPSGFHVPSRPEIEAELPSWSNVNAVGALNSFLKLSLAGGRTGSSSTSNAADGGTSGAYYTITPIQGGPQPGDTECCFSNALRFNSTTRTFFQARRSAGYAVRCVQD
jgi:hypothetical protein